LKSALNSVDCSALCKALSTLSPKTATFLRQSPFPVASVDRAKLSPVYTVTENGDCRRKVRLSPFSVSHFSATVAVFCDSRQCGQALS